LHLAGRFDRASAHRPHKSLGKAAAQLGERRLWLRRRTSARLRLLEVGAKDGHLRRHVLGVPVDLLDQRCRFRAALLAARLLAKGGLPLHLRLPLVDHRGEALLNRLVGLRDRLA